MKGIGFLGKRLSKSVQSLSASRKQKEHRRKSLIIARKDDLGGNKVKSCTLSVGGGAVVAMASNFKECVQDKCPKSTSGNRKESKFYRLGSQFQHKSRLSVIKSSMVLGSLLIAGCILLFHLCLVDYLRPTEYVPNTSHLDMFKFPDFGIISKDALKFDGLYGVRNKHLTNTGDSSDLEKNAPVQLEEIKVEETVALKPNKSWCAYQDVLTALQSTVSDNAVYIQTIADNEHIILAKNNIETLRKWTGKSNMLFICINVEQCALASVHNISCLIHESAPASAMPSFLVMVKALEMKYQVINCAFDASIVAEIPKFIGKDLIFPYGKSAKASSFYIGTSTQITLNMHRMGRKIAQTYPNRSFVSVFKSILNTFEKKSLVITPLTNCTKMPDKRCSILYHPFFKEPAERVLWLKEKQLWLYDKDGYYTCKGTKYLSYETTIDMGKRNQKYQIHALKNALAIGNILKRIVILPKFLCWKCNKGKCASTNCLLNGVINITKFDRTFNGLYREHSFRGHKLLPMATKKNISDIVLIEGHLTKIMMETGGQPIDVKIHPKKKIKPNDLSLGLDSEEVTSIFEDYNNTLILRIFHMYGVFSGFNDASASINFEKKLRDVFNDSLM